MGKGVYKRQGTPAWKRPAGKKGEGYVQVDCVSCEGKGGRCPLCEGHKKIWVVR